MAGELVPVVLFSRYTTLAGPTTFETLPLDVRAYSEAVLNLWRGPLNGPAPAVAFETLQSVDRVGWSQCPGPQLVDPGSNTEAQYLWGLTKPWFRLRVIGLGPDFGVTFWAQGFLVKRET